ncbi:DUF6526 family protein [Granulicella paludicola]|jgi:hypothetical protein|uniref:DUF6526 family protein n=1 Tax=Granulicella paludicola TaxID=474951 RepID=UPI0021DF79B7|nr:DUF6526 family protein [Granulicella paludicola]
MASTQDFKNHTRWDPPFHYFLAPVLVLNFAFSITYVVRHYPDHAKLGGWWIVMSLALIVLMEKTRGYALKAQNRVIRLEEKLRLLQLCSPEELVELESLTIDQYVGLRFASNPELPELARRAIREKLTRKQIKESIKSWRADNDRV